MFIFMRNVMDKFSNSYHFCLNFFFAKFSKTFKHTGILDILNRNFTEKI